MAAPASTTAPGNRRHVALIIAALLVLTPALIQALTPVTPVAHFDVDPRSELGRASTGAIGPAGLAWLHTMTLFVAAAAMGVALAAGGVVRWWWAALTAGGVAVALAHLRGPTDQWLQVGAWASSACLGLAAAHLAQHEGARRWIVAGFVALLIPFAVEAAMDLLIDHPATVARYFETKAHLLASRGWEEGSPQALLYERRLTDPALLGAYGFSNVFGSIVAGLTLLSAGLACRLTRAEDTAGVGNRWIIWVPVLLGVGLLLLTRSKGVVAAAGAGGCLLVLVCGRERLGLPRATGAVAAAGFIAGALLFVAARGWMGAPETWEGERSLFFRWQYWGAAARMFADASPVDWLLGIGPARFHAGYEQFKDPLSPEAITSTHSVFIDWVTMLGLGGLAWSALVVRWLIGAGRGIDRPQEADADPLQWSPVVALTVVVFATQYYVREVWLLIDSTLAWLVGAIGFAILMAWLVRALRLASVGVAGAAFLAAAVILIHAQIEMTFFQYASLPMVWLMLGLAAGASVSPAAVAGADRRSAASLVGALTAFAVVAALAYATPMSRVQSRLAVAAAALQDDHPRLALDRLDEAGALAPADPRILRWRINLRIEAAMQASRLGRGDLAQRALGECLVVLEDAGGVLGPAPHRLRSNVHFVAADALNDPRHLVLAAEAREAALALSPQSLSDQVALADLYDRLGRRDEALAAYRRALELSDRLYLDQAMQLTSAERARVEAELTGQ